MSIIQQLNLTGEQKEETGECSRHRRIYEVFCTNCNVLICASCLMFEPHKGHQVCNMEDAKKDIRKFMDSSAKEGLFKVENTENILLDIRHAKLTCEEMRQKAKREVDETFNTLIKTLKDRKQVVLSEVDEHFKKEVEKLSKQEERWVEKQELCVELINYLRSTDDQKIIQNAERISAAMANLREKQSYENIFLINKMNTNLALNKEKGFTDLSQKDLIKLMEKYVTKGEVVTLQFKC